MILDRQNRFSGAQAITASAVSEDVIDLSEARDIGAGENLFLLVVVTTAFTDAGSDSTLQVDLQTDDNEAFASPTVLRSLGVFPALSAIGSRFLVRLDPAAFERYIRLNYTVANGNFTTAAVTAAILKDADVQKYYPDAITIS